LRLQRVRAFARKEFTHILRDPRTLAILIMMPMLQLTIFGYAMRFELRHVKLAVCDHAHNTPAKELIRKFRATSYFIVQELKSDPTTPQQLFNQRKANAYLSIPPDFDPGIPEKAKVQLLIDASDANAAQLVQVYCREIIASASPRTSRPIIDVRSNVLYNPDLKSAYFFVPGLIAMILVSICALLTSISITREKELGTMEQILVSPVSVLDILIGKILPYVFLGLVDAMLILLVGMGMFKVPFTGSFIAFLVYTLIYIATALSLGLMVSAIARTQQVAMMMALALTLLPTIMLSGFIFPIRSMPWVLRQLTYIIPARYFLQIIRGIMIKGNTTFDLWQSGAALCAICFVAMLVAYKRFKLRLK
jgi:ABC-2 type transport system permease protein